MSKFLGRLHTKSMPRPEWSRRLIGWLIGWLIDWLIDWLNDWLLDWLHDIVMYKQNGLTLQVKQLLIVTVEAIGLWLIPHVIHTWLMVPGVVTRPTMASSGMQSIEEKAMHHPTQFAHHGYTYVSYLRGVYQTNPNTMMHCCTLYHSYRLLCSVDVFNNKNTSRR